MVLNPLRAFVMDEEEDYYGMTEPKTYLFLREDIDTDDVTNKNVFPKDDVSNVIISVEDQELHLNKDVLRLLSPVFKTMLNSNSAGDSKINLPDKKADDVILFFSFFYPDRKIPLKDKFDYFAVLKLSEEYKTAWLKERIENYLYWRVATFYNDGKFVHKTKNHSNNYIMHFKYRCKKTDSNSEDSFTSYDDTIVLYIWYLAERFELASNVVHICKRYVFELELCYLKNINVFKLLSEDSKFFIYGYCLKRALASYEFNEEDDTYTRKVHDLALELAVDEITTVKQKCSCIQEPKRKKII